MGSPRTRPQDLREEALDISHLQMLLFPSFSLPPEMPSGCATPGGQRCSELNQIKLCPCFHFSEQNLFYSTQISLLFPTSIRQLHWNSVCPTIHTDQRTPHSWLIQQETESQAGDSRAQHPAALFCWVKTVQGTVPTGDSRNGASPVPVPFTGTDRASLSHPSLCCILYISGIFLSNNSQPCPGIYPADI